MNTSLRRATGIPLNDGLTVILGQMDALHAPLNTAHQHTLFPWSILQSDNPHRYDMEVGRDKRCCVCVCLRASTVCVYVLWGGKFRAPATI